MTQKVAQAMRFSLHHIPYHLITLSPHTVDQVLGRLLERRHLNTFAIRYEGFGLEVREDSEDDKLAAGDRVIEVNGEDVLRLMPGAWQTMLEAAQPPYRVVRVNCTPVL